MSKFLGQGQPMEVVKKDFLLVVVGGIKKTFFVKKVLPKIS
jgi:hypothetical protein